MDTERSVGPIKHLYGTSNVGFALKGVRFPISKSDLLDAIGHTALESFEGQPVLLREVLDRANIDKFLSPQHVLLTIQYAYDNAEDAKSRRGHGDPISNYFLKQRRKRNFMYGSGLLLAALALIASRKYYSNRV